MITGSAAIQRLADIEERIATDYSQIDADAVGLAIEAIKWIQWRRRFYRQPPIPLLEGEIKEVSND